MKMGGGDATETATKLQKLGESSAEPKKYQASKLSAKVQGLVNFIYDKGLMEQAMASVGYDVKRLPLGELSNETVLAGYKVLRQIEEVLGQQAKGKLDRAAARSQLQKLSDQFYTVIPHNFGFKPMSNFVIASEESLKEKLDLISNLLDINVAVKAGASKNTRQSKSS